jgi:hypothetical protein
MRFVSQSQIVFEAQGKSVLIVQRKTPNFSMVLLANFAKKKSPCRFPMNRVDFRKVLDSADVAWAGLGSDLPENVANDEELVLPPLTAAIFTNSAEAENA